MELGDRIAAWRKWKGLERGDLARALGLTHPAVYQWETGTTAPSVGHLEQLVELLGVTMERFYGRVPKAKKKAA